MTEGDRRAARAVPLRPPRDCPICGRRSMRETFPFCSKRCADIDLNRWLSGVYAIPVVEEESGEESGMADPKPEDGS